MGRSPRGEPSGLDHFGHPRRRERPRRSSAFLRVRFRFASFTLAFHLSRLSTGSLSRLHDTLSSHHPSSRVCAPFHHPGSEPGSRVIEPPSRLGILPPPSPTPLSAGSLSGELCRSPRGRNDTTQSLQRARAPSLRPRIAAHPQQRDPASGSLHPPFSFRLFDTILLPRLIEGGQEELWRARQARLRASDAERRRDDGWCSPRGLSASVMRCCTTLCSPVASTRLIGCVVACHVSRTGSAVMRSRTALSCIGPLQPAAAANGFAVAPRQGSPRADVQQMPRGGVRRPATALRACGPTQGWRPPDKRSSKSRCVGQAAGFRPCGNGDCISYK